MRFSFPSYNSVIIKLKTFMHIKYFEIRGWKAQYPKLLFYYRLLF